MTRDEAKKILMIIQTSYPNFKPVDLTLAINTWHMMLSDFAYEQVAAALKAYIMSDTSGFAPSIGQLVAKLNECTQPMELNELEAWSLVSRALRNGYYGAEKEFAELPPLVQKAVGSPGNLRNWAQTDMLSIENVVQSNFIKTYRTVVARAEEVKKYPPELRTAIEKINENVGIAVQPYVQIEEKPRQEGVPLPQELKERYRELFE